ncbi:MAG: hypothetical protein IT425_05525 [Pirellulales bacterium]|nr:hypothetical protein [Pirellulales bacterium]
MLHHLGFWGVTLFVVVLGSVPVDRVQAAAIPIVNAGFESVQIGSGYSYSLADHPGWSRVSQPHPFTGIANPPAGDNTANGHVIAGFGSPTEGEQFGWTANGFGLQQVITSVPFDASENYTLRVDAALSSDSDPSDANVGYIITFHLVGGILLGDQLEFDSASHAIKDGGFRTRTINYVGGTLSDGHDGINMVIRLQSANFGGPPPDRYGAAFDNIRLEVSPVPEPSSIVLAVSAIVIISSRRRARPGAVDPLY